jgi:hypothetical protein
MNRTFFVSSSFGLLALLGAPATAQTDQNPAMNAPDQVAWQLFIQANLRAGGSNSMFETWASDTDTFQMTPSFPTAPAPMALRRPVLPRLAREALQRSGALLPAIPPDVTATLEETRRNLPAFTFIKDNNLYKITGLRAAFGKTLSFPVDAIEVKANWVAVTDIPTFTNNRVTVAQVPQLYHVNKGNDGNDYALVAMHVISKLVPNWTWATFEHKDNPSRCDILGCKDAFGAQPAFVPPAQTPSQGYADCTKTPALKAMLASANIDPVYNNYCLKGSQTDFTDSAGLDMRVGNSVTESTFVATASCMTCHGRANFDKNGNPNSFAGFINPGSNPPIAPLGPIQPSWYYSFSAAPPIFENMPGLNQIATSADFVWSIPFCAVDDTKSPPQLSQFCIGK